MYENNKPKTAQQLQYGHTVLQTIRMTISHYVIIHKFTKNTWKVWNVLIKFNQLHSLLKDLKATKLSKSHFADIYLIQHNVIPRDSTIQQKAQTLFINVLIRNVNTNTILISLFPLTTKHTAEVSTLNQTQHSQVNCNKTIH